MMSEWALSEFSGSNFGDSRLSCRLQKVATLFLKNRSGNISGCSDQAKEVKATNRFFVNERVDMNSIHSPHLEETVCRAKKAKLALNS